MSLSFLSKEFYSKNISPSFIHMILLDQTFVHCPIFFTAAYKIFKVWTLFISNVIDYPLRSTKNHGLGKLFFYQLPNSIQAPINLILIFLIINVHTNLQLNINFMVFLPQIRIDSWILLTVTLQINNYICLNLHV